MTASDVSNILLSSFVDEVVLEVLVGITFPSADYLSFPRFIGCVPSAAAELSKNCVHNRSLNSLTECPVCNRSIGVSRFAAHLERCTGRGRTESRRKTRNS
ncbi:hypothetical protein RCL1_002335 [Eukaryota sp. TZLM3-RCL]